MSEDPKQQTVVDATKAPAEPGAADAADARGTGDDLDTLLAEYEKEQPEKPPEPARTEQQAGTDTKQPQPQTHDPVAREYIFRQDMNAAIKSVRGDLDPEFFDDAFVESWMDAQARSDPRLSKAWTDRHVNPRQFQKVLTSLGQGFAKKYGKLPDKAATEDREAVTHAVRGASTKAPEGQAPDLSRMSNAEFQAAKDRMFG